MKTYLRVAGLVPVAVGAFIGWVWVPAQATSQQRQAPTQQAQASVEKSIGTEAGYGIFQQHCMTCHGNPNATVKAPDPATLRQLTPEPTLRQLTPEAIYQALTAGAMQVQGYSLTDEQKRRVAESVSGRLLGTAASGDANQMPNQCSANPPLADPMVGPAWNGWGANDANTRFQPRAAAGITADQVPKLKLKWAFGYPGGVSAFGQPTMVSGRVFVGTDTGYVYPLDAAVGCVYWSFQTRAGVRNAMSVGPIKRRGAAPYAVYFGDLKANVYALDCGRNM